jgi:hypothetical protein
MIILIKKKKIYFCKRAQFPKSLTFLDSLNYPFINLNN